MPKIGSIGIPELLIILVVVLLIFGPRRLPDMAKGLGQSVREFRRGLRDMRKEFDDEPNDANAAPPASAPGTTNASTAAVSHAAATAPTPTGDSQVGASDADDVAPSEALGGETPDRKA